MTKRKHYAERDIEAQGVHYSNHVCAMTGEKLHSKSDIAAELAHRDMQIELLQEREANIRKAVCLWLRRSADKGPQSMFSSTLNMVSGTQAWSAALSNAAEVLEEDWDRFMDIADKINGPTESQITGIMGDDDV